MSSQKLHVYLVLEFKKNDTRVVRVCGSKVIAEGVANKLRQKKHIGKDKIGVLRMAVQGSHTQRLGSETVLLDIYEG